MKKEFDIFYFSGTHWDREWYQDFQGFRYRLVKMVDGLMELFDRDEAYQTFHFDGQTIVLEDYCEIAPEKKDKLRQLIVDRHVLIGPWYVMPDEFLVSGESLIRNLMLGHEIAQQWGTEAWKYGYVCDVFGHIAQMPQILNGFNIKYSLLGRGTTESEPVFFKWRSPDGSECLNYKLEPAGGYGNFKQAVYDKVKNPSPDNQEIVERLKRYIDAELNRANLPIVIIMDGLDHEEACGYTSAYIKKLAELYPRAHVHHVNLCEQGKLLETYCESLPVVEGELNRTAQQRHNYLHLITNTLSSYYTLKKQNDECQYMLEKIMEPMCVAAALAGIPLNRNYIKLAYKYLLQNQSHDAICGCSIDQVHKDMEYRFDQTKEICNALAEDYLYMDRRKDTVSVGGGYENVLTLYNMLPFEIDRTLTVKLDFKTDYPSTYSEPFGYEDINSFKIFDSDRNEIPYHVTDIKRNQVKRIRDNCCERYDVHYVTVRVEIPSFGKSEYRIVPFESAVRYLKKLNSGQNYAENEFVRMNILENGSLEILDKKNGKKYTQLCGLADDGEIGDGWYHVNPVRDTVVYSAGGNCRIEKLESGPSRCLFRITRCIEVPAEIETDKSGKGRSAKTVNLKIVMYAGLSEESKGVDIRLEYDNIAKDHRLRLLLPTGIGGEKYFAGQSFYCCERSVGVDVATQNWHEPAQYEKAMNGIVGKRDENGCGIAFVSNRGLHECAAYDDADGTLSVTLSRSFSTTVMTNGETNCQMNRKLEYEFCLAVLDENVCYKELLELQDMMAYRVMSNFVSMEGEAQLEPPQSRLTVEGKNIAVSVIKCAEGAKKNSLIVRVFNASGGKEKGCIRTAFDIISADEVSLGEEDKYPVPFESKSVDFELDGWKIATFKLGFRTEI